MSWREVAASAAALMVAASAVVLVGSQHPDPVAATARPQEQPITSATLSCPGTPGSSTPPTTVFAVGPDATPPGTDHGLLTILGAGVDGRRLGGSAAAGRQARVRVADDTGQTGVLVTAVGGQARGATAAQLSTYRSTTESGLAASWCETPRDEWWFNGVDTSVGTSTELVLSNPSQAVAVVDLHILGAEGVVDAAGASGIAIGPASRVVLDLARYAPGQEALTLHVTATRGTVSAAVSTTRLDGLTRSGADWVPASAAPSTTVVVNAAVGGVGHQSLVVTNTGTRQEVVSVRVLGRSGVFTSTLLPDLQVPPESTVVKSVTAVFERQATAVELSAAGPVTGALVSEQAFGPRDFAISGVSAPLTALTVVPASQGTAMTLSFAMSTPGPQQVEVQAVDGLGKLTGEATITVNGLATTAWKPPTDWRVAYLRITVSPGSNLHAVVSYAGVAGVTQLPLQSAPRALIRPPVLPF